MKSCMRCGIRLSHNYLVTVFTNLKDVLKKRVIVCLKCRDILKKGGSQAV